MFESFYKLSANPFRLTPDPKFCFRHPSYNQAYAYLQYALKLGEGFIMVTGRPGIGKTTLVEVFLTEIEQSEVVAARIASANVEAADLLRVVAYSYGIDVVGLDKATILLRLEQFFIQQTASGRRVLLIIDEAQGLPHIALEELRLLADLQIDSRPLLQLFLVGQEKLRELMRERDMEQFQQRVIGVCHLEPLDLTETRSYMQHRLRTAGWKGDPELTGAAVLSLYRYSKGVPRHVNKICIRLLLHGMLEEKHELHQEDVLSVAEELRAEELAPMELDETVPAGAAEAVVVPELEGGSLSIADLALRADPQQAEQQEAGDTAATSAVPDVADATLSAQEPELAALSNERGTARIPSQKPGWAAASSDRRGLRQQHSRQRLSGVGEFPGQPGGRLRQPRAGGSPRAAAPQVKPPAARRDNDGKAVKALPAKPGTWRSLMSALSISLSRYAGETARTFGRLKWKAKLAVLVAALLVVNLFTAVFMMQFAKDNSDQMPLLSAYPQPAQKIVNGDQKKHALVYGEANEQVAAQETSAVSTPAEASLEQQAGDVEDDWFATIVDSWDSDGVIVSAARGMPGQRAPESGVNDSSVQEPVLAAPESDRAAAESGVTMDDTDTLREQTDEQPGDSIVASVEPFPQSGTVLSQDSPRPADEVETAEPGSSADSPTMTGASGAQATLKPVATEKTLPTAVPRVQRIAELLSLARESLKRDRLLLPSYDSAYKYYQQTLILDPGNDEALFGIERIVARYIALARKALEHQDKKKSRRYIDRGLSINPTDKRLLALRDSLNAPVAVEEEAVIQPPVIQADEAVPATEVESKPENFLSRLRAFFNKAQSEDRQNDVVVEERR